METEGRYRILYVDDEEALLRAFSRTLSAPGITVDVASSGPAALEQVQEHDYAVVISDFNMPGMNGADVFRKCREIAPDAWRILVTGFRTFDVVSLVVNEGAVDRVIGKPWEREELFRAVNQGVQHHQLVRSQRQQTERLTTQTSLLEAYAQDLRGRVNARGRQILDALMSALNLRDPDTARFCRRVAAYAKRIAMEVGLEGTDLLDLERGALLHDIGKIGVQDSVLLKPGALAASEWEEMHKHPELGYRLIEGIDFLEGAAMIVYHHQERWDGTGYPQGLSGDRICLGARILAIADAMDAITSNRPYRKARSFADARQEVIDGAGTQFDPELVKAFLRIGNDEWEKLRLDVTPDAPPLPLRLFAA